MKRWLWLILLAVLVGGALWFAARPAPPPAVPFAKVQRETLESVLSTNGKTEPGEWMPLVSARAGRLSALKVTKGQSVAAGQVLATLQDEAAEADVAAAQSKLSTAQAELENARRGGKASDLAELDGTLSRLKVDREAAAREAATLQRLVDKQAATPAELTVAKDRMAVLDAQISALERRRAVLTSASDITAAQARVRDSEAALAQARHRADQAALKSPIAGEVYDLPVRAGEWIEAGGAVARIGRIGELRVIVYVDEPDLGRVKVGLPVSVTWDALPGTEWKAVVEQVPTQVVALASRQVGEVQTRAENPARNLPPGANVNVRMRTQVVNKALTVPKSALRRENNQLGVYVASGDTLVWRNIRIGVTSDTRAEILSGVNEGESVALPSERALHAGMKVTAEYPQR